MTEARWHGCETCKYACHSAYDPSPAGVCLGGGLMEDWSCAREDEADDYTSDLANEGKCPLWADMQSDEEWIEDDDDVDPDDGYSSECTGCSGCKYVDYVLSETCFNVVCNHPDATEKYLARPLDSCDLAEPSIIMGDEE